MYWCDPYESSFLHTGSFKHVGVYTLGASLVGARLSVTALSYSSMLPGVGRLLNGDGSTEPGSFLSNPFAEISNNILKELVYERMHSS